MRLVEAELLPPRHRRGPRRGLSLTQIFGAFSVLLAAGCASTSDPGFDARLAQAEEGFQDDPLVRARVDEVSAAREREKDSPLLDELEIRVGGRGGDEERVRVLGRVPVASPFVAHSKRETRRAETQVALARLDESVLERRADLCFAAVQFEEEQERAEIYRDHSRLKLALLAWNEQMQRSGAIDRAGAAAFALEQRVEIAAREPLAISEEAEYGRALPTLEATAGRLVRRRELVHQLVSSHNPSVSVHRAMAERHRRQSQEAHSARLPSLRFVDVFYDVYDSNSDDTNVGGQVAVSIPFGRESRAKVGRYRALDRSQSNVERSEVLQRTEEAVRALAAIDHFETNLDRWEEISLLAEEVSASAQLRLDQRFERPSRVERLLDRAYAARTAVLDAREEWGVARCVLLQATGVALEDWPRE
jgi:hypothetical protein